MVARTRAAPRRHWSLHLLPLATVSRAVELYRRLREVEGLRQYAIERQLAVLAALLAFLLISVACAVGVVVFLADRHSLLALLGILLLPVAFGGSLFVQLYVFFSWVEGRALEQELGQRGRVRRGAFIARIREKAGIDLGPAPDVPWILAALGILLPLALLAATWPAAAAVAVLVVLLVPVLFAKFAD